MHRLPTRTKGPIHTGRTDQAPAVAEEPANVPEHVGGPARGHGAIRLLRFPEVRERTGLSRSTIWRLERGGAFPRHRRISANAVAWVEEEVMSWIRSKIADIAV